MSRHPTKREGVRVFLRFTLASVLSGAAIVGAGIVGAQAQVNIDQGKSAAQIFANDCAACHKATRGLANGKNSLTLTSFLREHYTASREQAAALAAYVLGAGGNEPAPKAGQKPGSEHAKVEEPKAEPRTAAHTPPETVKPEAETPATTKLQPPEGVEEAKPEEPSPNPAVEPSPAQRPAAGARDVRPANRSHKPGRDLAPPAEEQPAPAVAAAPAAAEKPGPAPSSPDVNPATSAVTPAEPLPGEAEPVPRDNIPD
jgi:hypothetical protein